MEALADWSFFWFWVWDSSASTVRWMTSFASSDADVSRFATGVRQISGQQPRGSKS